MTITLDDEIDIARGDMLRRRAIARRSPINLRPIWSGCRSENLLPGRSYLLKINHCTLAATVTDLKQSA